MDKAQLRIILKRKRKASFAFSSSYSKIITDKLLHHPKYLSSKKIGIYVSLEEEVNTLSLIEHALKEKQVYVPKAIGTDMVMVQIYSLDDLHPGHFHVLEPDASVDTDELDLMITPLLGYDVNLHRIGYGKGYYDRYFNSHHNMYKIGLAYSYQQVESICHDEYDVPLDEIITEAS